MKKPKHTGRRENILEKKLEEAFWIGYESGVDNQLYAHVLTDEERLALSDLAKTK